MQGNKKSKSATHISYGNNSNYKNITDEPAQPYTYIQVNSLGNHKGTNKEASVSCQGEWLIDWMSYGLINRMNKASVSLPRWVVGMSYGSTNKCQDEISESLETGSPKR